MTLAAISLSKTATTGLNYTYTSINYSRLHEPNPRCHKATTESHNSRPADCSDTWRDNLCSTKPTDYVWLDYSSDPRVNKAHSWVDQTNPSCHKRWLYYTDTGVDNSYPTSHKGWLCNTDSKSIRNDSTDTSLANLLWFKLDCFWRHSEYGRNDKFFH